jgi:hypothetical protein
VFGADLVLSVSCRGSFRQPLACKTETEAVEVWAANLQQRFGRRPIAVILEQARRPLLYSQRFSERFEREALAVAE